jgi:hypothetical protein
MQNCSKLKKKSAHLEGQILSFGTSKLVLEPFKSFRYHFVVITMLKDEKIATYFFLISYQNPTVLGLLSHQQQYCRVDTNQAISPQDILL